MKKIMFKDRYGLTKAVLEGRKTMTRRVITLPEKWHGIEVYGFSCAKGETALMLLDGDDFIIEDHASNQIAQILPTYKVGEVVAVAQSLRDMGYDSRDGAIWGLDHTPAWTNKMFVSASECIHQIRITNVRVERLQDISEEDCYREGIYKKTLCPPGDIDYFYHSEPRSKWEVYPSAREAFAGLIDKVSGKGTWEINPWVYAYEFELVK